jgi:hypothetical protein
VRRTPGALAAALTQGNIETFHTQMRESGIVPDMDASRKKGPFRTAFVAWLVFCWLLIPYPYGLLLFVLSAALQRPQEIGQRDGSVFINSQTIRRNT